MAGSDGKRGQAPLAQLVDPYNPKGLALLFVELEVEGVENLAKRDMTLEQSGRVKK